MELMGSQTSNSHEETLFSESVSVRDEERDHCASTTTLEHLISIWPILSSIAASLPVGDLISLSRTSHSLRNSTHRFPQDFNPTHHPYNESHDIDPLHVGRHQTIQWSNLKSLAAFNCSSTSHKDPKPTSSELTTKKNVIKPCKFCSRPICRACIVRSFFADPSSSKNTFRYRTRYLCTQCWETGNLRRDFRYPAESITREHIWRGQSYAQRGGRCSCAASEDNWLCPHCRVLQNSSGPSNNSLSVARKEALDANAKDTQAIRPDLSNTLDTITCYGLDCRNLIDHTTKDRRRVCLWCSKALPRQFGGEERLKWEQKQLDIRAAAAASRSADIREWARNRFRSLSMSRREMRGTNACIRLNGSHGPEHDAPIFVRHLDAINYRQFMAEDAAPSPDAVYQSKHGRWTYSIAFLKRVNRAPAKTQELLPPAHGPSPSILQATTQENAMRCARTNKQSDKDAFYTGAGIKARSAIITYAAQMVEAGIMSEAHFRDLRRYHWQKRINVEQLRDWLFDALAAYEASLPDNDNGAEGEAEEEAISAQISGEATRELIDFDLLLAESYALLRLPNGKDVNVWKMMFEPPPEPAEQHEDQRRDEESDRKRKRVDGRNDDDDDSGPSEGDDMTAQSEDDISADHDHQSAGKTVDNFKSKSRAKVMDADADASPSSGSSGKISLQPQGYTHVGSSSNGDTR